ncbi:unnamed protein product [Arctogadus glacialis]
MPRSTVHRIVHRVTEEVVAIRHKVIRLPKTPEDLVAVTHGFRAIFLQALEVHHTFVPHVITACAILHNICLGADDIMAPEEEDEPEDDVEEDEGGDGLEAASGAPWRDQLSAEVSALEEAPPDHQYIQ